MVMGLHSPSTVGQKFTLHVRSKNTRNRRFETFNITCSAVLSSPVYVNHSTSLVLFTLIHLHRMNTAITSKFSRFIRTNVSMYQKVTPFCTKSQDPVVPVNPLKEVYSASQQPKTGVIYDKKPFKIRCEAGKLYSWCSCGQSKSQPFCDGMHRNIFMKITLRPIRFTVTETKDYWLCNCKQTSNRPFCDGTHKREDIQELKR